MLGATGGSKNYMFEHLCGKRDVVDGWMDVRQRLWASFMLCISRFWTGHGISTPFKTGYCLSPLHSANTSPPRSVLAMARTMRRTLLQLANYNNSWTANKMTEQYLHRAKHTSEVTLRLSFSFSTTLSVVLLDFSLTALPKGSHST